MGDNQLRPCYSLFLHYMKTIQKKILFENCKAYLFLSPWIIGLIVFIAYPVFATFYYSMTDYSILKEPRWIGFDNYNTMFFEDPFYWKSVWNTIYFTVFFVPLQMISALGLALLLNSQIKGLGVYRTIFYLPQMMPIVAGTLLWYVILDPRFGLLNSMLELVGIPKVGWLRSAVWSKPGIILMSIWGGCGYPMLIFLAGLKDIPEDLLEASKIDGAGPFRRFYHVVIPLLTPTIFFNLVITIITSFQVFTSAYIAGSDGGSASTGSKFGPLDSLLMYMIHLYRSAFRYFELGYASAMSVVMFLSLTALILILLRSSSYWVYYQGSQEQK